MSASNSKVEDQKIQQNHATGVTNERAFSFPEEDESLSKKTAQILFSNTVQQKQALSWYPGKNGLLKNIVDRSHQVQAVGAPCEPNQSIDADVGVLGCDDGFLCKESPSHDGDYYCVADQALHSSRRLEDEEDCDYSDYDYGTGLGTVVCTYSPDICGEYGLPENTCARLIISVTFDNPEDTYEYDAEACYNLFEGEYDADGDIVKMCALRGSEDDPYDDSCSLLVEGDSCSTCTLIDAGTSDGCVSIPKRVTYFWHGSSNHIMPPAHFFSPSPS